MSPFTTLTNYCHDQFEGILINKMLILLTDTFTSLTKYICRICFLKHCMHKFTASTDHCLMSNLTTVSDFQSTCPGLGVSTATVPGSPTLLQVVMPLSRNVATPFHEHFPLKKLLPSLQSSVSEQMIYQGLTPVHVLQSQVKTHLPSSK